MNQKEVKARNLSRDTGSLNVKGRIHEVLAVDILRDPQKINIFLPDEIRFYQKPRNAPGQQPCLTSQDPEPTLRTSISGGVNEPADHTAGASTYTQYFKDVVYNNLNNTYMTTHSEKCHSDQDQEMPVSSEELMYLLYIHSLWEKVNLAKFPCFAFVTGHPKPVLVEFRYD
ncbi:hypothetical protein MJG53_012678 [Ovis ammon polii x Ovis aries]|uniref:Uncharacterized protein n=1 Tax=Ovis ammon polii x Ovis aries TaxID=2918886 RepID=A0ACB9UM32_9CETA|nr:hypothetical protein MJG53_012678 [Ovis ammon polii x Ovis aries]